MVIIALISVNLDRVRSENRDVMRYVRQLNDVGQQLAMIRHRMDSAITQRRSIGSRLIRAGQQANELEMRLQAMYDVIEYAMEAYARADRQANDHPFKEPKKALWRQVWDGVRTVDRAVKGFREGLADSVVDSVVGLWDAVTHPVETVQGIVFVAQHPKETAKAVWQSISDSWENDVVDGDVSSSSKWFGYMVGQVVGDKGVGRIIKAIKGARIVQEAGGARVLHHVVEDQPSPPGRAADIELKPPKAPETPSSKAKAVGEGTGKATLGEIRQATEFLRNNGLNATQRREVIEAFNPGAQVVKLQDDLVVYRYSGGVANPRGRWVTTEQLSDPVNQLALPPGSTAENVTKWVIPKGTEVFKGTVAPNFGKQGGAAQIYLPDPSVLK